MWHDGVEFLLANPDKEWAEVVPGVTGYTKTKRTYRYADALRALGYDGAARRGVLHDYRCIVLKEVEPLEAYEALPKIGRPMPADPWAHGYGFRAFREADAIFRMGIGYP